MSIKESVTVGDVVEVLNRATKEDAGAIRALIENRVPCNKNLSDDPTIQVSDNSVGLLGIINGIFGINDEGWGTIAAEFAVVCEKCGSVGPDGSVIGEICACSISKHLGQIDDPCICGGKLVLGDLLGFRDLGKR